MMMTEHECLHEEQLLGQSRAIERLDAELSYKKERLDEIKEDNRRMEDKIDDLKDCVNQLLVNSKQSDSELEARLIRIESDNKNLKQEINDIKEEKDRNDNKLYLKLGLLCSAITITVTVILHFI